jgi:hypothetical protein
VNARAVVRRHDEGDTGTVEERSATAGARHERRAPTFDNVLERWRHGCAKAGLGGELGASNAMLRTAAALHRLQLEAVERTRKAHEQAQGRLAKARSVAEMTSVGLQLAQTNAEDALHYWSRTAEITLRGSAEGWADALTLVTRAQGLGDETGRHWLDAAAKQRPAEALEAQLNQLVTPAAALPMLWPAQESVREAVTLGTRAWHDWLAVLPSAARSNGRATPTAH